jgi:NAD+---dinitrogen-reductase ADP-D-ribosyltransferase
MRPPENLYHENIAGDPSRSSCSLNRCNLSPWIIGSDEFQARPLSIEIEGVRTTDASLFRRLAGLPDANERGRLFHDYVAVKFGLKERIPRPDGAKPRPVYSYLHLLRAWGVDSNGPAGAVLKAWVESRFGILATYHAGRLADDAAARDAFLIDRTRGTARAMGVFMQLDLLYTFCQDELRRRCAGEQWRVLYRGTHDPEEYTLRPDTDLDPDPRTVTVARTWTAFTRRSASS